MSNETETAEAEVTPENGTEIKEVSQIIQGSVTITLRADGAMQVNAPQNVLLALAIVKAGEVYLTMQMQDAMKRSAALRQPAIVKADAGVLSRITRPS